MHLGKGMAFVNFRVKRNKSIGWEKKNKTVQKRKNKGDRKCYKFLYHSCKIILI